MIFQIFHYMLSDENKRTLRSVSNDFRILLVPRTRNKFDDKCFSAAGTRLWNNLPPGTTAARPVPVFRQKLKTLPFDLCT